MIYLTVPDVFQPSVNLILCHPQHITHCVLSFHSVLEVTEHWCVSRRRCITFRSTSMLKDTITNHSELDFGEKMHEEIHKQTHLKKRRGGHSLFICRLDTGKAKQENTNERTKPIVTPIVNTIIHRTASYFLAFYWMTRNISKNF